MKCVHLAAIGAALLLACGTRVSLGDLPEGDPVSSTDGTEPSPDASAKVDAGPAPDVDGGSAIDAGPAPGDDSGDQDGGKAPYVPCAGKVCGAPCTVCDPSDITCSETAVLKQCDKLGACVAVPTSC